MKRISMIAGIAPLSACVALMAEGVTAASEPAKLDADQIKERKFFPADKLQEGVAYLSTLVGSVENVEHFYNFDPNNITPPAGSGLLIVPMQKRSADAGPMQLTGFSSMFVPDMETVITNPKGAAALQEALFDIYARKARSIINGTEDGQPIVLPNTLDMFFDRQARGEGLQAFLAIAKSAVKQLKDQGFKKLDVTTFRNILMSSQFASARYPKIPQTAWLAVMDKMKTTAAGAGLDTSIYDTWKSTRDETNFDEEVETLDLSGLGLTAEVKKD